MNAVVKRHVLSTLAHNHSSELKEEAENVGKIMQENTKYLGHIGLRWFSGQVVDFCKMRLESSYSGSVLYTTLQMHPAK